MNEMLFRYVWYTVSSASFEENVRIKVYGDDNIWTVNKKYRHIFNPVVFSQELAKIGVTYTSDVKDAPLSAEPRPFEKTSFLGAVPVQIEIMYKQLNWVGRGDMNTFKHILYYTRDKDVSLVERVTGVLEMATIFPKEEFLDFEAMVWKALPKAYSNFIPKMNWDVKRRDVALRTSRSQQTFFHAQGPGKPLNVGTGQTTQVGSNSNVRVIDSRRRQQGLPEPPKGLDYGLDSWMHRIDLVWKDTMTSNTILSRLYCPSAFLSVSPETLQDMPFNNFKYWKGIVRVKFVLTGNPLQAGLLLAYFVPFGQIWDCDIVNSVSHTEKVFLTPSNMEAIIDVPFRYNCLAFDTNNSEVYEELGVIVVRVISPLVDTAKQNVTISVWTQFADSEFFLPKAPTSKRKHYVNALKTGKDSQLLNYVKPSFNTHHKAHTSAASTTTTRTTTVAQAQMLDVIVNDVLVEDPRYKESVAAKEEVAQPPARHQRAHPRDPKSRVREDVKFVTQGPVTEAIGGVLSTELKKSDSIIGQGLAMGVSYLSKLLPFDSRLRYGSEIGVTPQYPGMSMTWGNKNALGMQLNPGATAYTDENTYGTGIVETNIEWLLNKENFLGNFTWDKSHPTGKCLFQFNLGSTSGLDKGATGHLDLVMSQFWFWRADIVLKFRFVRTRFDYGKLKLVVDYSSTTKEILYTDANRYNNQTFTVGEDNDTVEVVVPYNSNKRMLRTASGANTNNNYFGRAYLFVQNPLLSSNIEMTSIDVVPSWSLRNARVAVPKGLTHIVVDTRDPNVGRKAVRCNLKTQGDVPEEHSSDLTEQAQINTNPAVSEISADLLPHCVSDILDVMRRYIKVPVISTGTLSNCAPWTNVFVIANEPTHTFARMYGGWKGSMNYRIQMYTNKETRGLVKAFWVPYSCPWMNTVGKFPRSDITIRDYCRLAAATQVISSFGGLLAKESFSYKTPLPTKNWQGEVFLTEDDWGPDPEKNFEYTFAGSFAQEIAARVIDGHMVVNVPYQSEHEFIRMDRTNEVSNPALYNQGWRGANGFLVLLTDGETPEVHQAVGDDFSMGAFASPMDVQNITVCVQVSTPDTPKFWPFDVCALGVAGQSTDPE